MAHAASFRRPSASAIVTLLLCAIGCARSETTPPSGHAKSSVRATAQAIVGGSPSDEEMDVGLVRILGGSRGECTGKMITQRWAVTAASCFCASDADAQGVVNLTLAMGPLSTKVTKLLLNPQMDTALLRADQMLPLAQPEQVWGLPVDYLAASTNAVSCYGHSGAPTRIDGTLDSTTAGTVFGTSDTQCGTGGLQRGVAANADVANASLDAGDLGGPCFMQVNGGRMFIGMLTAIAPGPTSSQLQITAFDQVGSWLHATTDIWSSAECGTDVPDTQFSLDPVVFQGVPDTSTFTLVAQNAYGDPSDPAAPQLYIRQSSNPQSGAWTELASPVLPRGVEGVSASPDGSDSALGRPTILFTYLDADHVQRSFWYDQTTDAFLLRDHPGTTSSFQSFDGVGKSLSHEQPLLAASLTGNVEASFVSLSANNLLDWEGRRVNVGGGNAAAAGQPPIWRWSEQASREDERAADITHRVSNVVRSPWPGWVTFINMAFRDLQGNVITTMASLQCATASGTMDPWCPSDSSAKTPSNLPTVTWDIPTGDLREVALGLSGRASYATYYYAVTVAHDGSMRLWWLGDGFGDGKNGHAVDLGAIGDKSGSMPKLFTVNQAADDETLYMAFTSDSWSARVRPVGNCLGNTPTWW